MKKLIVLFVLIFTFFSCGSSSKIVTENKVEKKKTSNQYDESFDPLSLDDDDIVINKNEEKKVNNNTVEEKTDLSENEKIVFQETEGFRVQIFATRSMETATLAQQKAIDLFSDSKNKVYLVFEAPLYRLRVGDALSRQDADEIRELARERGYDEAFVVRSKIVVPENSDFGDN